MNTYSKGVLDERIIGNDRSCYKVKKTIILNSRKQNDLDLKDNSSE